MAEEESSDRMPVPEPPGIGDDLLESYNAIGGKRAAPGPSTVGAANPQLQMALNQLIQATQLDPDIQEQLRPCIRTLIDLITNRTHILSMPMATPGAMRKPPEIPAPGGAPTGSPLGGAMSMFQKGMAGGV
jgi:hypothetical protein